MDVMLLFKIGGIALTTSVLYSILVSFERRDLAGIVGLGGFTLTMGIVVVMLNDLFNAVKTMFLL